MSGSTGLILEKLLDDRMGKSQAKIHRREIEKIKSMMREGSTLIKTASFYCYTTGGILKKDIKSESITDTDYFFFYYILRTNELPIVVKYIPEGNVFMIGVDLTNSGSLEDNTNINEFLIRHNFRRILADINRKYLKACVVKIAPGSQISQQESDAIGRSVLQEYFTDDGMKIIDSIYSSESDFLDSIENDGTLSKVSNNGVARNKFFDGIYKGVSQFVESSDLKLKFREGYFKFTSNMPNIFPMYLISFEEDKFIVNRIFQKTYGADSLLKRMKGKKYGKDLVCSIDRVLMGRHMMGMSFEGLEFVSDDFLLDNKNISQSSLT